MKTKLIIILTIMFLIILNTSTSNANTTYGISIDINPEQIKVGETFKVTLSVHCSDGINGIDTTYNYDTDMLELVSAELVDTKNWSSLGTDNQITIICNSTEKITEADIYTLTFRVKEDVAVGDTAIISTSEILLDSDAETDSEIIIDAKKLSITVAGTEEGEKPTDPDNNTVVDGNEIVNPDDNNQNQEENNTIISKPENTDNTVSSNKLPYTGMNIIILLVIAGLVMLSIGLYRINNKYKNI